MSYLLTDDDARALEGLRAREEEVFAALVRMHAASMLRVAQIYVSSRAVAEEVVQETWIAVIRGLDRFEGRASLRTWMVQILINIARNRGARRPTGGPYVSLYATLAASLAFATSLAKRASDSAT